MPLHLQEINRNNDEKITHWFFHQIHNAQGSYITEDERYILLKTDLINELTNEVIGKIVYTSKNEEPARLLDIDIVLNNRNTVNLNFVQRLLKSSERNEYYVAETDNQCRFLLETVDRYRIEHDILNTAQDVHLCVFPFEYMIFDDMEQLNMAMGVKKEDIFRIDEKFINPMSLFEQSDETYSFMIGKVVNHQNVMIDMDGNEFRFIIAYVDSGIGVVPAAFHESVILEKGKYIAMYVDIKADFEKE